IEHCGPVVWGYGDEASQAVNALFQRITESRALWRLDLHSPQEAVAQALGLALTADRPIVSADAQDNPGAGGNSTTTGMLHALLSAEAGKRFPQQVALGLMNDPAAAQAAHKAGVGARIHVSLGCSEPTWGGQFTDPPLVGEFLVRS